jgi:hypothetical protein
MSFPILTPLGYFLFLGLDVVARPMFGSFVYMLSIRITFRDNAQPESMVSIISAGPLHLQSMQMVIWISSGSLLVRYIS